MDQKQKKIIENFVNSPAAVEIVENRWDWDALHSALKPLLNSLLTPEEEQHLHDDLRDWWKNGNFYHWEPGEVNPFGMERWRLNDPDFWP